MNSIVELAIEYCNIFTYTYIYIYVPTYKGAMYIVQYLVCVNCSRWQHRDEVDSSALEPQIHARRAVLLLVAGRGVMEMSPATAGGGLTAKRFHTAGTSSPQPPRSRR